MLILNRKDSERIVIGDAQIVILKAKKGKVRVGIIADRETKVLRGELIDWHQTQDDEAA